MAYGDQNRRIATHKSLHLAAGAKVLICRRGTMKKLLSLCALPVLAAGLAVGQQNPPATSTDANNPQTARVDETRPVERKPDYGWLGLLGLAGLLGLRRREVRVDRTTIPVDRSREDLRRAG
jgi:MYXO-CTERM domain-containing protein